MVVEQTGGSAARRAYHHGDLRNALTEAAVELARTGGPQAIVLREAARAVGVSSTAAYRHFANREDLVRAVQDHGFVMLAAAMHAELAAAPAREDRSEEAIRRLRAAGAGYVRFALAEPGLFRTIFHSGPAGVPMAGTKPPEGADARADGLPEFPDESYTLMSDALDELVVTGRLPAERRPYSDIVMWSAVHGLSVLLLDTELADVPPQTKAAIVRRGIDVAMNGL
ncbi:TetR/AcrR family transcriptional regulator [Streptomyces sp. SID3343]|uniref:WHG domain-containing protein n=1 Tax=Streptomyces sp. SID3343 TaxID=2690260 RepID=UPI001371C961|nr:TetR family transcriptional regulator [Streptomyces sp. SID3343]